MTGTKPKRADIVLGAVLTVRAGHKLTLNPHLSVMGTGQVFDLLVGCAGCALTWLHSTGRLLYARQVSVIESNVASSGFMVFLRRAWVS
jgi:hypothetical protein